MTNEIVVSGVMDATLEPQDGEARVNVTYDGSNSELPQPVSIDATEAEIKSWVTEAVQNGDIPGISADPSANFSDFVVDRFPANPQRPYPLIQIRPKTPFG